MKAKPVKIVNGGYVECSREEATHVTINLPGPVGRLSLPIVIKGDRHGTGCWTWNQDTEHPTLRPSVLVKSGHFSGQSSSSDKSCWCSYYKTHPQEKVVFTCHRCHTWVNNGNAQFLPDSSHELAGQTVALLEV